MPTSVSVGVVTRAMVQKQVAEVNDELQYDSSQDKVALVDDSSDAVIQCRNQTFVEDRVPRTTEKSHFQDKSYYKHNLTTQKFNNFVSLFFMNTK